ncbi:hypothetical protein T439DRAFT_380053 [Meredithblackwellia eburnea MCA 4105]
MLDFQSVLSAVILLIALCAPVPVHSNVVLLASGKSMKSGQISDTLRWQSSGTLIKGGCPSAVKIAKQCFTLKLLGKGQLQKRDPSQVSPEEDDLDDLDLLVKRDDGSDEDEGSVFSAAEDDVLSAVDDELLLGEDDLDDEQEEEFWADGLESDDEKNGLVKRDTSRQRIELYSWPKAPSGRTFLYQWSYNLRPVNTGDHFFHIAQLIRRNGDGGPVVTLNALKGRISFQAPGLGFKKGSSVPLSRFVKRTTRHIVKVKYGSKGSIDWLVKDGKKVIMSFHAKGNMGVNGSIKFGLYRRLTSGMKAATAYAGDYSVRRVK